MLLSTKTDTDKQFCNYMDYLNKMLDQVETEIVEHIGQDNEPFGELVILEPAFRVQIKAANYLDAVVMLDKYNVMYLGYNPTLECHAIDIYYKNAGGEYSPCSRTGKFTFIECFKFLNEVYLEKRRPHK